VAHYHGYVFAWAIIYTFWYHPMENTSGHLIGFLYTFLLMVQGSLFFTRIHVNKYWMVVQEVVVLIHGTLVAIMSAVNGTQPANIWAMFFFGFLTLFVVTQMYGLDLKRPVRWAIIALYFALIVIVYNGRWGDANEILRIPVVEYGLVFVLALLYWLGVGIQQGFQRMRTKEIGRASAD
jgi:hypothetical protein